MADITPLGVTYLYRSRLAPSEVYAIPKPTDLMVWELCPYLRNNQHCHRCPESEIEDDEWVVRGCRVLATEACRVVLAAQKRGAKA